ncbi:potassium-transporting ATPase subunit KdpC [Dictyobacter arantiisoli]
MSIVNKSLRPAIMMVILFSIIIGLIYPGIVTAISQVIFPYQANGSLHTVNGQVIGSDLIGQEWTSPRYFHGRPSATLANDGSKSQPYNAQNSAASNLGPTNKTLIKTVKQRTEELQKENPGVAVPVDLVTSSGSGLDPDITPAAAYFQIPRIANERGLTPDQVKKLVADNTTGRFLWIFGEAHVNVLNLNIALDALKK